MDELIERSRARFAKRRNKIEEDFWMGMSFKDDLLEFTRANRVEKERAIQNARSRGGDQKDVDKARKSVDRKQEKQHQ